MHYNNLVFYFSPNLPPTPKQQLERVDAGQAGVTVLTEVLNRREGNEDLLPRSFSQKLIGVYVKLTGVM